MFHTYHIFFSIRPVKRQLTNSLSVVGMAKNITLESEDEEVVLQLMKKNNIDMNSEKMVTKSFD